MLASFSASLFDALIFNIRPNIKARKLTNMSCNIRSNLMRKPMRIVNDINYYCNICIILDLKFNEYCI